MRWRVTNLLPLALAAALLSQNLPAESLCARGPRGFLVSPCLRFATARRSIVGNLGPSTPDLLAQNGTLFEVDRNGGPPRPLMVDLRPGREGLILGASNPDVIRQVLDHLGRIVGGLQGFPRRVAQVVLQRHGRNPNGGAVSGGQGPVAQTPEDRGGDHGQGGEANGGARRPAFDPNRLVGEDGRALPEVCRNLHDAVCSGTNRQQQRKNDENRVLDVLRKFRSAAGLSFNTFVGAMQGILDTQPQRFAAFPDVNARNVFARLMSFLVSDKDKEIPSLTNIKTAVAQIKDLQLQAIDKMDFPDPDAKKVLRENVRRTKFRVIPNFTSLASIKAFVEGCGPDGMAPSAFALPETNETMICPGLLVSAGSSVDALVDALIHVVPHEEGHNGHLGVHNEPNSAKPVPNRKFFTKLEQCLRDTIKGFLPKQTEESVADTIGAAVLKERVQGKSPAEILRVLRSSTNILCFTSGNEPNGEPGEHPSGLVRINDIIGRVLSEPLGCGKPTAQAPVCLVQGQVPPKE